MENIVFKESHLKHLKICTESGKQYISVLPLRIHGQMKNWNLDKGPSISMYAGRRVKKKNEND